MKWGIVTFPGSNCDYDCHYVLTDVLKEDAVYLWHKDRDLKGCDVIVLPGGFSYGDYLRCGAIARFAPVMEEIVRFAKSGGIVIGICNGFQILTEAGLLPGALIRNRSLQFICKDVHLKVENHDSLFTRRIGKGVIRAPIAHGEGCYHADDDLLERIEGEGCVAFRYAGPDGRVIEEENPNGARNNIAGILSFDRRVLGMMPHPERCCESILNNTDGLSIFLSILDKSRG